MTLRFPKKFPYTSLKEKGEEVNNQIYDLEKKKKICFASTAFGGLTMS